MHHRSQVSGGRTVRRGGGILSKEPTLPPIPERALNNPPTLRVRAAWHLLRRSGAGSEQHPGAPRDRVCISFPSHAPYSTPRARSRAGGARGPRGGERRPRRTWGVSPRVPGHPGGLKSTPGNCDARAVPGARRVELGKKGHFGEPGPGPGRVAVGARRAEGPGLGRGPRR